MTINTYPIQILEQSSIASTVEWTKLKDDSSKTATTFKMVDSSIENSLMPLVQLSLLLPNVFQLFTNEPISISERKEERVGFNLR